MKNLTTLDYWTKAQGGLDITLNENNVIEKWINDNLNDQEIKTSIEVGCYPGKFLTILGKRGVEVNGIDFIPAVSNLGDVFKRKGYNVGEFIHADFTKYKSQKKYDCVMSFGFIEHFSNWEEVMIRHLDLVSENGYVIIEVPNFKGFFQRVPRFIFDYENYKRHNISSMDLKKWNEIMKKNGFEIITSNHFGGYQLWFEGIIRNRLVLKFKKVLLRILKKSKKEMYPNQQEHSSFSCVLGIIAKRTSVKY
jgi:2-polyprenyl-3-methyl-5-hydroxy-6-metoxy-1,4-benzoquinol methylase